MSRGKRDSSEGRNDEAAGVWQPVDDWTQLLGRFVEIHRRGIALDFGRVDAVTDDGAIFWLAHDGANTRRIITKQDDVYVRLLRA